MMGISKDVLIVHCDHNNSEGGVAPIVTQESLIQNRSE